MRPDEAQSFDVAPQLQLARLMDGYLTTQLLYVAAKLGVADVLGENPQTAASIASTVGAEPNALYRVLRGLAAEGVLDELEDGRFGLTALGSALRIDAQGALRGAIIARGDIYFLAAADLLDAVREGEVAFERAYGSNLFEYLSEYPELGTVFQQSMSDRSRQEAVDVVASYDFDRFRRLVDVGGGTGILLEAILSKTPHLRGVLLDRPAVIEQAKTRLEATGLAERCEFVAQDFFVSVTPGDALLLSRVIHDWSDEDALRILTNCHRALEDGGTLLLVEAVLPKRARDVPAAIRMDLNMLMLLHGRERTAAEFELLLTEAGFQLSRIVPTNSPVGLSIIEATKISD
jgi:ubiquinone/menaquinone biosynthesis C-methylase UbiE